MKKEIATRWVKALRSGKYKQGKCPLKYKTKAGVTRHCCLGVLCELYNQDKKKQHKKPLTVRPARECEVEVAKNTKAYAFGNSATVLPGQVMRWAGMRSTDGELPNERENLAEINDDGASFRQIAQIIEKEIENL